MKRFSFLLVFTISVSLLHSAFFLSPWGETLEIKFLDLWFHLRTSKAPSSDVVVIAMDEDSYGVLGLSLNQPWPRALHAELLKKLEVYKVRRAVFDILFLGPGSDPAIDQKFAEAISSLPTVLGVDYGIIDDPLYQREGVLLPYETFEKEAENIGLVSLPEDAQYIRRFMTERSTLTADLPSLSEAAVEVTQKPGQRDFINYYGPARTIPTYSYYQVLDEQYPIPAKKLQNKTVFIGTSLRTELGPAQKDAFLTPFDQKGRTFGVEIHATAAANLIEQNWIRRFPVQGEVILLSLLTILLSLALILIKPFWGAFLLLGTFTVWSVVAYTGFLHLIFLPGAALTTTVLPFTYLSSTLYYYVITRRKQRQLQRAFQYYLSPEMAREVARNPQALQLGGENIIATAMFTDIAGFTDISTTMKPEEVAHILNVYFTEIVNIIFEKKGTLIKFIGDAVFALWGAPVKCSNHTQLACKTAENIQKMLDHFNASGRFPVLKTRIGIHTGPMVVGNLGSERRFDYTAIGDAVNLASRVEALNKYLGTHILYTESSKEALGKDSKGLKMGNFQAVGQDKAIGLYALFSKTLDNEIINKWDTAVDAFLERKWKESNELFQIVASRNDRLKKAAEFYLRHLNDFQQKPPPQEWKGEISFTSK